MMAMLTNSRIREQMKILYSAMQEAGVDMESAKVRIVFGGCWQRTQDSCRRRWTSLEAKCSQETSNIRLCALHAVYTPYCTLHNDIHGTIFLQPNSEQSPPLKSPYPGRRGSHPA